MRLVRGAIERPVLVTVIYVVVFLFGLIALTRLPLDLVPEIVPPVLSVVTIYPGASADDVEQKVSRELEDALGSINHLKEISSVSRENLSLVVLQLEFDTDLDEAANDIRSELDLVRHRLPADVDEPQIRKFDSSGFPVLHFAVTSTSSDIRTQKRLLEDLILEPLRRIPGVGQVSASNLPEPIVRVDVERARLTAHGLTLTEVARTIGAESLNAPAGTIDVGKTEFAVRMPGQAESLEELGSIVIARGADGGVVRLRDVATIAQGIEDPTEMALVDGKLSVGGSVIKVAGANSVDVAAAARAELRAIEETLPAGMQVHVVTDTSELVNDMIGNLKRTVSIGGLLVLLVAFVFLGKLRPSLIVATTIPASMVLTFLLLFLAGFTLNFISLMAMALAIGMVVDNGIVVLENITRFRDEGQAPADAALKGASEVAGALMASTSTTLVIFLPLVFVSGIIGVLFEQLAYVMIVTIAGSLVVALTLTPALAARLLKPHADEGAGGVLERLLSALEGLYRRHLGAALRHPFRVLGAGVVSVVLTAGLVGMVGTDFMPRQDSGEIGIVLELPVGTRLEETIAVGERVVESLYRQPGVQLVLLSAGMSPSGSGSMAGGKEGSNVARIDARLLRKDERSWSDQRIARTALAEAGPLLEVVNLQINLGSSIGRSLGLEGKPIVIEVLGSDLPTLERVASEVRRRVAAVEGTTEVSADLLQTRPEIRLELSREQAGRVGVSMASAAGELRASVTGLKATRFRDEGEVQEVVVRLREEDRGGVAALGLIPVRSLTGSLVSLAEVTRVREGEAPIEIKRSDNARIVTVDGDVLGRALGSVALDVDEVMRTIDAPPGVTVRYGGAVKQQRESFVDLFQLMALGLILVYLVLAAQFESWLDPLVILFSVPFAITGAFLALAVTGTLLSTPAFLGLIILVGVVVNNAIVLLDYVRQLIAEGLPLFEAIVTAGERRLRPVLMTTMTTVGGMFPMALATGNGAEMWGPMGRTALGGLLVSTVVTLIFVPTLYSLVERWRRRGQEPMIEPMAAGEPAA